MSRSGIRTSSKPSTAKRAPDGTGSVYRRSSDGRLLAQLYLGKDPETQKPRFWRYYQKQGEPDEKVYQELAKAVADRARGTFVDPDKRTVAEYLTWWLEMKRPSLEYKTALQYAFSIDRILIPKLGAIGLQRLTGPDVRAMLKEALTKQQPSQQRGRGDKLTLLSARTVHTAHAVLRNALNDAVNDRLIGVNPAALVDAPKVTHEAAPPLDDVQAQRFLAAVQGDPHEALWTVAVALGLRQGEALGLTWPDIDVARKRLTVNQQLQWRTGTFVRKAPKRSSRRTLPLPAFALAALQAHKERQAAEKAAALEWENDALVFTTPTGRPLNGTHITKRLQRILAAAGLPHQTFHQLRHLCAALLIAQGAHPREVMEILGHSSIGITMTLYGHIFASGLERVSDRMDAFFTETPDTNVDTK